MTQDAYPLVCPRCRAPMRSEWHRSIEIDRCPTCGDLWFDRTELTTYVADRTPGFGELRLGSPRRETDAPGTPPPTCPRCRAASLQPYEWDGHRFSRCERCSGVQLKGSALDEIIADLERRIQRQKGPTTPSALPFSCTPDEIIADLERRIQRQKGPTTPSEALFWLLFVAR